jgi:hypothetical protein
MAEQSDFKHLVDRREKVGIFLLELREIATRHLSSMDDPDCSIFHLLLAAAFSLWRAAFLMEGQRDRQLVNEHAKQFLDVLLWDNAINFPQDRRTHGWTGGYYLNNACLRLMRIRQWLKLSEEESKLFDRVDHFVNNQWEHMNDVPDLGVGWEDCHAAAKICLTQLRARTSR